MYRPLSDYTYYTYVSSFRLAILSQPIRISFQATNARRVARSKPTAQATVEATRPATDEEKAENALAFRAHARARVAKVLSEQQNAAVHDQHAGSTAKGKSSMPIAHGCEKTHSARFAEEKRATRGRAPRAAAAPAEELPLRTTRAAARARAAS